MKFTSILMATALMGGFTHASQEVEAGEVSSYVRAEKILTQVWTGSEAFTFLENSVESGHDRILQSAVCSEVGDTGGNCIECRTSSGPLDAVLTCCGSQCRCAIAVNGNTCRSCNVCSNDNFSFDCSDEVCGECVGQTCSGTCIPEPCSTDEDDDVPADTGDGDDGDDGNGDGESGAMIVGPVIASVAFGMTWGFWL